MADETVKICGLRHPDAVVDGAPQIVDKYCTAFEGHLEAGLGNCRFRAWEQLTTEEQSQVMAKGGSRAG